jgi:hypothetical protein
MIYEMLAHIKKRPRMYLGEPSITAFSHYVHGFEHALTLAPIPPQEDEEEFQHFKKWLAKEFRGANLGWHGQILFLVSREDQLGRERDKHLEEQALKHFFELLEQYSVLFRQTEERVSMVLEKVAQETHLQAQKILADSRDVAREQ